MKRTISLASCVTAALLACVPASGWAQDAPKGADMPTEMKAMPKGHMSGATGGTGTEGSMPMGGGMTAEEHEAAMKNGMMAEGGMAQDGMAMTMETPDPMPVYFSSGSARINAEQQDALDAAVRTFRDGDWNVLMISGVADTVGNPEANLDLSLRRARAVAAGLVSRGVSVAQIQILGRGNSELEVPTDTGVPEEGNRVAMITWR